MISDVKVFQKTVADILDYTIDYTKEMDRVADTIISSSWIIPSADSDDVDNEHLLLSDDVMPNFDDTSGTPEFSLGGTSYTTKKATVFISGGTAGVTYTLENRAVTAGGRRHATRIAIQIKK